MTRARDLDPMEVEWLIEGTLPAHRAAPASRTAAVLHLTQKGWSAARIGERLRMSPRTVHRHRHRAWTLVT